MIERLRSYTGGRQFLVGLGVCCACSGATPAGSPGVPDAGGDSGRGGGSNSGGSSGGTAKGTGGTGGVGGSGTIIPPIGGSRSDTLINDAWKFIKADVAGAEKPEFDDKAWAAISLPHTWNADDGQDGPQTPYYRGIGWYRRHYTVPADLQGKRLYLQFDGANIITDVFVNGTPAGSHSGGYAAFRFDVTALLKVGADNVIAVKVDNSAGADKAHQLVAGSRTVNIAPLSADYTFFGGIYRNVHLLATEPLAISPMDYASSGVYVKQTNVSAASADLAITVKLSNAHGEAKTANLKATILDAAGSEVQSLTTTQAVPANGNADALLSGKITNPHLWNGIQDPYMYSVRVELLDGTRVADAVTQPLGLRYFSLDPNKGFFLNGKYLDLHGVNKHQDHKDKGWAISDADTDADFVIIKEIGSTAVRLAHYQHAQHTYDVTDKLGLITWAETPVINRINDTPEFKANSEQQLIELIRQNYNHPSIVFWSVGNEVLLRGGPNPDALIAHLSNVADKEDPTRLTSYAANGGNENHPVNWHGVAHGFNEYHGWYFAKVPDFAVWADALHQSHPKDAIGVTEYGAGASVTQHAADPASKDVGGDHTTGVHTEEYQAYYHEGYWTVMSTRPFLWGKFVWNGFDFASDGRTEGTTPGLNDKGLVTFDRQIKKDAFYWYKANWSSDPFVHITSRRFTTLPKATTSVKVYSNAAEVELKLNGKSLGKKTAPNHIFTWTGVTWAAGANEVEAIVSGSAQVSDKVTWTN